MRTSLEDPRFTPIPVAPDGLTVNHPVTQTAQVTGAPGVTSLVATLTLSGVEEVMVPAGTFSDASRLQIRTQLEDASGNTVAETNCIVWLASSIGAVKLQVPDGSRYELISATVGGKTVP